jgi:surfeit locus 1 family protein
MKTRNLNIAGHGVGNGEKGQVSATGKGKYTPLFFLTLAVWGALVWALCELGMWQLRRAAEKQNLIDLYQARISLGPVDWQQLGESDVRYRRVRVRGQYDVSRQFLLDNQIMNQQAGYHVLTPFIIETTDQFILVNRGWIPLGASRERLPILSEPRGVRELTGLLDRFPSVGLRLKGAEMASEGWPSVVQMLDSQRIAARLGKPVHPMQLLLDDGMENGYAREWRPVNLMPEKNKGYAFQWFALAAVTAAYAILWAVRGGYRRKSAKTPELEK